MTKATSSSERYEAARVALINFETATPENGNDDLDRYIFALQMAATLRALIEPAQVNKNIDDLVREIASDEALVTVGEKIEAGIQAGIQAAWESWEYDMYAPDSGGFSVVRSGTEVTREVVGTYHHRFEASAVAYAWNIADETFDYRVEEN